MKLLVACPSCRYSLPAEAADGSRCFQYGCPNCGHPMRATSSGTLVSAFTEEPDEDELATCGNCGALMQFEYSGKQTIARCSARCTSRATNPTLSTEEKTE